jgi:hypothetical protein
MDMYREPLRDDAYWQKWIDDCIDAVAKQQDKLKVSPFPEKWKRNSITQNLYYDCMRLITLKYSSGTPVEDISEHYPQLIDAWVGYNQHISSGDNKPHLLLKWDYERVLTLISWGILFNADQGFFQKIADHMHSDGEDLLIETLLATKLNNRIIPERIIYPKSFELLCRATQTSGGQQTALVKEYLSNWYKNMKDFINYDAHKAKGEGGFEGYWSFEAAAVVALYNIDDSSFRDMDFYPKDMADFAKVKA